MASTLRDKDEGGDADSRVVLHLDLDAFYVSVEREINPALRHVPLAVSQYNPYGTLEERSAQDFQGRWVVQGQQGAATSTTTTTTSASNTSIPPQPSPSPPSLSSSSSCSKQHQHIQANDMNGSLIAVSYEARATGVKRNQRGREACRACPELHIVQVPVRHGKADLTLYRTASKSVMETLQRAVVEAAAAATRLDTQQTTKDLTSEMIVEIASIDEVYMDVTKLANRLVHQLVQQGNRSNNNTYLWQTMVQAAATCTTIGGIEILTEAAEATNALGKNELRRGAAVQVLDNQIDGGSREWWNRDMAEFCPMQLRLVCGAFLAARARAVVQSSFDGGVFTLSAGISTNKTLAKLASGLKKPNRQTLIYRDARVLQTLFHPLPLGRIRGLGGKYGDFIASQLQIETVGQLAEIPLPHLEQVVSKNAQFLYDVSRGLCIDPVVPRSRPKSIECSKTFRGHLSIPAQDTVKLTTWVGELCSELMERLQNDKDEYHRMASTIKVSVQFHHQKSFISKQMRAPRTLQAYPKTALEMIQTLIQTTQKKILLTAPESKNLKITAMGVGGMQFLDIAEGSSSILSFATPNNVSSTKSPSINSDTKLTKRPIAVQTKRSGVALWLEQSQILATPSGNTRSCQSHPTKRLKTPVPKSSRVSMLNQMLSGTNSTKSAARNHIVDKPAEVAMPSMDEVDPEVLNALPKDLQRAVLSDIRYQKSKSQGKGKGRSKNVFDKGKGGIKNYFEVRETGRPP